MSRRLSDGSPSVKERPPAGVYSGRALEPRMSEELLHLTIETGLPVLAYELAADLEGRGLARVQVKPSEEPGLTITHAAGLAASAVTRLLDFIRPLEPENVHVDQEMSPGHAVLRLGKPADTDITVELH